MPQVSWTVHQKRKDNFTASALTSDWPTVTRGGRATLRFWFDADDTDDTLLAEDGESVTIAGGDSRTRQRAIKEGGGSITVDGTLTVTEDGLFRMLQYIDWAGAVATWQGVDHQPGYREQHPGGYVDALTLGFEPAGDIQDRSVTGLWGVVTGGTDLRNSPLTNYQVEVEVFVLGEFRDYTDHFELEDELSA